MRPLLLVVLLGLAALPLAGADEPPFPPGTSENSLEGLRTWIVMPRELPAGKQVSLVVILHGAGGTAEGMAGSLASWADDGYVVCAPKSTADTWSAPDVQAVLRIASHMKSVLPIDPKHVHVVGFSNGGWNLPPIAFDDALKPCSATWVASGFEGGSVPKWASGMGVIALAGSEDPNLRAARATVKALEGKVRTVEVRVQQGIGHAWPDQLVPYLKWWMGVQEGRFTPGDDLSFDWKDDVDAAVKSLEGKKKGGVFVWFFDPKADAESAEAKEIQHDAFFDPEVRRLGAQLACVKVDRSAHADVATRFGVTATPAVVVLDVKGESKKALTGKIKASALQRALRLVAPEKTPPKD